jgi:4a-hydroxytetrahydrobiopterin dehydratase
MIVRAELLARKCAPQKTALDDVEVAAHLAALDGWILRDGAIEKSCDLGNFHQVMDFVDGIAAIVHQEDHHPELTLSYKHCRIRFNTHSVNQGCGGISINDFICAAKIDALWVARCASP